MNQGSNDYYNRAQNFLKVNPGMAAVVLTNPDAADAERQHKIMVAWFTYFSERGLKGVLANCERILSGAGKAITFPCDDPEMFDPSFVMPRHKWHKVEPDRGPRTRNIAELHQRTMAALRSAKVKGAKPEREKPQGPTMTPQEWLNDYQANPPPIPVFSDEFKRKLGLCGPDRQDDAA